MARFHEPNLSNFMAKSDDSASNLGSADSPCPKPSPHFLPLPETDQVWWAVGACLEASPPETLQQNPRKAAWQTQRDARESGSHKLRSGSSMKDPGAERAQDGDLHMEWSARPLF